MWHLTQTPLVPSLCLLLCFRPSLCNEIDPMTSSFRTASSHQRKLQMSPDKDSPSVSKRVDDGADLTEFSSLGLIPSEGRNDGVIYGRRSLHARKIDYAGLHPFEVLERRRRLLMHPKEQSTTDEMKVADAKVKQNKWHTGVHNYWFDPKFTFDDFLQDDWYDVDDDFDPETMYDKIDDLNHISAKEMVDWKNFRPIRIQIDTRYLDESFSDEKKDEFIEYDVLPAAIQYWSKALMVFPAKRLFVDYNHCKLASPSHYEYGFNNADLILYVSSSNDCINTGSYAIAGADSCDWDQFDRPIAGHIKFCYDAFPLQPDGKAAPEIMRIMIEVAIHEIGHVLGLRSKDIAFFYDRITGLPRTPRPVEPSNDIECVAGKKSAEIEDNVYRPAPSTLRFSSIRPGIKYYEIVTPTVKRIARSHFNCPSMTGMRLENQPTSESCFGEHWEERLAWDASMSAIKTPIEIPEHISPLTLALLEDSGWYRANYKMSREFGFGRGAGCDFVEKPCIVNDTVPDYSAPYFCNSTSREDKDVKCDPSHTMMAFCDLYDLSQEEGQPYPPVPQVYRYFDNPAMGPKQMKRADFCPMYTKRLLYCTRDPGNGAQTFTEESWAIGSRCYNSNLRPFCFHTSCSEVENAVMVKVGETFKKCEYDGQRINAAFAGESIYFECPKKAIICPDLICPYSCSGNGDCDWESETCICDGEIQTEDCIHYLNLGDIGIEGVGVDGEFQIAVSSASTKLSNSFNWFIAIALLSSTSLIFHNSSKKKIFL